MSLIAQFLPNKRAILAPMAGITDLPFRRIAARYGAGLTISEMVASRELATGRASTALKAEMDPAAGPAAVQIAGREACWMAEAARIAADAGAALIDINMGCPAKKVTSGASGAALMRDPDHALSLIEAVVGAVDLPVTLKMRLGWDEGAINAPDLARRAVGAGVRMVTVHGRTRQQFYKGRADWRAVAAVRRAAPGPLVVNGDIVDAATARAALARSGADAVMIGRAAQGAPWTPGLVAAALAGRPATAPGPEERLSVMIEHYEAMLSFYGRDLGVRVARKHLGWYLAPLPGGAALRAHVLRLDAPAAVIASLRAGVVDAAMAQPERAAA